MNVKKMSRNVERSIWRNSHKRRSPRISKVDADTDEKRESSSSKSRTEIKRKFNHNEMESTKGGGNKQHYENRSAACGEPNTKLPEKRILEIILDTLQRKDVHEIFAEPVDPEEVEDYYEIIENPMDFGTMRAKLHEGLYQNLQQFEHDVFLIPNNAMHFNSSSSIYFRQARGIYEVAEKLFEVLKTDPEHFELEFSREKRRSITRAMGKTKSADPSIRTIDHPQKYCSSGQLASRKSQGRTSLLVNASNINKKNSHLSFGGRKNWKFQSCEVADRRSTHAFQPSFNNVFGSVDAGMDPQPKLLYLINQQDLNYSKSLMSFVKDLGPTAQKIARKKLKQWPQNSCNNASVSGTLEKKPVFSTVINSIPSWLNSDTPLSSSSHTVLNKKPRPLCDPGGSRDRSGTLNTKKMQHGRRVMPENNAEKNEQLNTMFSDMKPAVLTSSKKDNLSIKNKPPPIDPKEIKRCNVGNLNSLSGNRMSEGKADDARRPDDNVLPVVLALEHPRLDTACDQLKPREKKSSHDQSFAVWQSNHKEAHFGFWNSQPTSVKAANDGVKKTLAPFGFSFAAKPANDGVKTLAPSGFSFAAPLLNQAHLTNNQRSDHFQGIGLDGFAKLRHQGAVDNHRGRQEEAGSSSKPFVHEGFNNQLLWPPKNPPSTNFGPKFPPPWRGFVMNGNSF